MPTHWTNYGFAINSATTQTNVENVTEYHRQIKKANF